MTINQSFQNWTVITDEPGEELVFEHEDPDTGQKDRFVLTEEAGLGSEMDPLTADVEELNVIDSQNWPKAERQASALPAPNYQGHPSYSNPVLTADDVQSAMSYSDVRLVADPFGKRVDGECRMLHEVQYDDGSVKQDIVLSKGPDWGNLTPTTVTLSHDDAPVGPKSYPLMWLVDGRWYLLPMNAGNANPVLYELSDDWQSATQLTTYSSVSHHTDTTVFKDPNNGLWWLITGEPTNGAGDPEGDLYIYYASDFTTDNWTEHTDSPYSFSESGVWRPGGRPHIHQDSVDIVMMDNTDGYGEEMLLYRTQTLNESTVDLAQLSGNPVTKGTGFVRGWNYNSMHHIDHHYSRSGNDVVIVDGSGNYGGGSYSIGVLTTSSQPPASANLKLSSNQASIPNATQTKIEFDAVNHDLAGALDADSNSYIPPTSGVYSVKVSLRLSNIVNSLPITTQCRIVTDGTVRTYERKELSSFGNPINFVFPDVYVNKGDSLFIEFYQTSGDTVDISKNDTQMSVSLAEHR